MLIVEKKSGGISSHGAIQYASPWSNEMRGKGGMKFYEKDITYIVDVTMGDPADEGIIRVYCYPHNNTDISLVAIPLENEIREVYNKLRSTFPRRTMFTINLENKTVVPLSTADFTRHYPQSEEKDELFIFDSGQTELFEVYVFENVYRRNNPEILYVLAAMSHDIMDCVGEPTVTGKEFTYILMNSRYNRQFTTYLPYLQSMKFPTNGKSELPKYLKTDALEKFSYECGADTLTTNTSLVPNVEDVYGKPAQNDLLRVIQAQIGIKGSANLSDIFQVGLKKVLESIPLAEIMIDVVPDIAGVGRRMCMYKGKFHIIPTQDDFDVIEFFGESQELFELCTDETFPVKSALTLPIPPTTTNLLS